MLQFELLNATNIEGEVGSGNEMNCEIFSRREWIPFFCPISSSISIICTYRYDSMFLSGRLL